MERNSQDVVLVEAAGGSQEEYKARRPDHVVEMHLALSLCPLYLSIAVHDHVPLQLRAVAGDGAVGAVLDRCWPAAADLEHASPTASGEKNIAD